MAAVARRGIQGRSLALTMQSILPCSVTASQAVASSSRVTLTSLSPRINRPSSASRRLIITTRLDKRPSLSPLVSHRTVCRGMVTITRQPESPEEPEVFGGNEPPSLILTDRAIEHLAKVAKRENNPDLALRISVESGGCHGYQYKMELTNEVEDDDFRFSSGPNVHINVDSTSLRLIKGSTIDYVTELIGSQFAIFHNPQAKGAGCGCGVSWEPNF